MNICICCARSTGAASEFHGRCLRKLFGVDYVPKISFVQAELSLTAQKMAGRLSISGVQPKLSMKFNRQARVLEPVAEGGEYILKPQVQTFPNLPQNENLCMSVAAELGVAVPPHALLKLDDGSYAYIVKRFDREKGEKIHQEDFQQILGGADKYQGSYEEIGKKLRQIAEFPGLTVQYFYERVVYNFLIGNGDAHMKNFSIQYGPQGEIHLAPAYDIVSSKLVIPDEEDCALTLMGKKNNLTGRDFHRFAEYLEIPPKAVKDTFAGKQEKIVEFIAVNPFLSEKEKQDLKAVIADRFARLKAL
jgi:serine/threonine-protein kinase HipA